MAFQGEAVASGAAAPREAGRQQTMIETAHLEPKEHEKVSTAVAEVESRTSGEIVTILAEQSEDYGDIQMAWSAIAALLKLFAFAICPSLPLGFFAGIAGGWNAEWTPATIFTLAAFSASIAFAATWLFQLWPPLKFLLIPAPLKTARVHKRAITCFRIGAERRTSGRTGILIYLSMREHRAEILADQAIAEKVDPEIWGDAMAAMLAELKQGRVAEGMVAAVEQVGRVLAEHLPRTVGDINEIPDRLIEI